MSTARLEPLFATRREGPDAKTLLAVGRWTGHAQSVLCCWTRVQLGLGPVPRAVPTEHQPRSSIHAFASLRCSAAAPPRLRLGSCAPHTSVAAAAHHSPSRRPPSPDCPNFVCLESEKLLLEHWAAFHDGASAASAGPAPASGEEKVRGPVPACLVSRPSLSVSHRHCSAEGASV